MGRRAVFLDRDGTIAKDVHYCRKVEDFELLPTVPQAIRLLNEHGFKIIVITNQSGIARGYFSEKTLDEIHQKMKDELAKCNAWVDAIYFCPHHPDDNCECRKPKTALFLKAIKEHDIEISRSYVVGDTSMDIEAGKSLGCKTVLVTSGPKGNEGVISSPDHVAENLLSAAEWIVNDLRITTTIIVPAFNEEKGLPVVLSKIFNVGDSDYEVIVVDDGSTDRTGELASRFPCRVLRHKVNKGKGEALKTGISHAKGENIIWIDADDTYPVDVFPQMVGGLKSYDMVVCSRRYGRENIPLFNRFGNWIIRNMIKKIYGFKPFDPLTGLWGVKKCYLEKILPTVRYAPDAEIGIKAARIKLRMLDIPITYKPRIGRSKLNVLKGGYEHFKLIFTLLFWQPDKEGKNG